MCQREKATVVITQPGWATIVQASNFHLEKAFQHTVPAELNEARRRSKHLDRSLPYRVLLSTSSEGEDAASYIHNANRTIGDHTNLGVEDRRAQAAMRHSAQTQRARQPAQPLPITRMYINMRTTDRILCPVRREGQWRTTAQQWWLYACGCATCCGCACPCAIKGC